MARRATGRDRALAASEQRLRAIIATEPECVKVVSAEGRLLEMNPAGLAMLEADSLAAVQARPLADFLLPEHRAAFEALHRKVMGGGNGILEFEVRGLKGTRRWLETHAAPLRNAEGKVEHLLGITRDITERRHARDALQAEQRKLRRVLDSIPAFVALLSPKGEVLEVNEAPVRFVGRTREQVLGQEFADGEWWRHSAGMRGRVRAILARATAGETVRDDLTVIGADGAVRIFDAIFAPLRDAHGEVVQVVGSGIDITERTEAEAKIRSLNRLYAVLSGINAAIVRIRDRDSLFREACRVAVEEGGFRMAWIGLLDRGREPLRPVASAGAVRDFFEGVPLGVVEAPGENGLVSGVLRERKAMFSNDTSRDLQPPMREKCEERGIHSLAVLPLMVGGEPAGVLALYAGERGFFDAREMRLLEDLAGDVAFAIESIQKAEQVDHLAYYDPLTGLANRALMHERLAQELRTLGEERPFALMVANIDRFKEINDAYGRHCGDGVLREVAQRLQDALGDAGSLARTGGDSFAVLVPEPASEEEAARLANRLLEAAFGQPVGIDRGEARVAGRIGIAMFPDDARDGDALFHRAESAMKKAKMHGEGYSFYTRGMSERIAEKLSLEALLRRALQNEEFVLHYQPKVTTAARALTGMEALIRWRSPELGLVSPMQFIPLMEETGLILDAGAWALRRAALDHRLWSEHGLQPPRVAVNVSPIQLRQRDFVERVERAIMEGAAPVGIDVEITESMMMQDVPASIEKLARLRGLGVRIAIDDFGTGYSSLAYLARLPVQTLKIDRSFITTMLEKAEVQTLVQTIVALSRSLGLTAVAEGVDSEEQAARLRDIGCDEIQGYLVGRPVPFDDMTALLAGFRKARG